MRALCISYVFVLLPLNPLTPLLSGWRNLLTFLLLIHQLVTVNGFLSKFKDPSSLNTTGAMGYIQCLCQFGRQASVIWKSSIPSWSTHRSRFLLARLETCLKWQLSWNHAFALGNMKFPPKDRKACSGYSLW